MSSGINDAFSVDLYLFYLLAVPHGMLDLSSTTADGTLTLCTGSIDF